MISADALGEPTQSQQSLAKVRDLERGQRVLDLILGGHVPHLAVDPHREVTLGGFEKFQAMTPYEFVHRIMARAEPLPAHLDDLSIGEMGVLDPPADAVPRLEHDDVPSLADELLRRGEPGQTSTDDHAVDHGVLPLLTT